MKTTPFLPDRKSPRGMRVQCVSEGLPSASLIYPDQPTFLVDGRILFFSEEGWQLCHPETLQRETFLTGVKKDALSITPGGGFVYWISSPAEREDFLEITRWTVRTGKREVVASLNGTVPGTRLPVGKFPLRTISRDGKRMASSFWLGDGQTRDAPFGIFRFDFEKAEFFAVAEHRDFINTHLQYCKILDPVATYDLLIQNNHGSGTSPDGKDRRLLGPPSDGGVDLHIIHDDGTRWRDLPFGRDGKESLIGHQVWRGLTPQVATISLQNQDWSYGWADGTKQEVLAGTPVAADPDQPHKGRIGREEHRVVLSKGYRKGRFCHLCCDDSGLRTVVDTFPIWDGKRVGMNILVGDAPDLNSPAKFRYLLNSGIVFTGNPNGYHCHPILSPDGKSILFNSDLSGSKQVYMITDF